MKFEYEDFFNFIIKDFELGSELEEYTDTWEFAQFISNTFQNDKFVQYMEGDEVKVLNQTNSEANFIGLYHISVKGCRHENPDWAVEEYMKNINFKEKAEEARQNCIQWDIDNERSCERGEEIYKYFRESGIPAIITWSISEKQLPENVLNSKNWLGECFYGGSMTLEFNRHVRDWMGTPLEFDNPTWGDILKAINHAFYHFIKDEGALDHIFLEDIKQIDIKEGVALYKTCFGS